MKDTILKKIHELEEQINSDIIEIVKIDSVESESFEKPPIMGWTPDCKYSVVYGENDE